jgi:hypothetical protein
MTTTPSTSPNMMSPVRTRTPPHSIGVSISTIFAAFAVQRTDAAVKHGELHLPDMPDVADQPVRHASGGSARHRGGGQQLAPRRDALGRPAAAKHGDFARLQIVDQADFKLIRVLSGLQGVRVHVKPGSDPPRHDKGLVAGPNKRTHGLVHIAKLVEHVGKDGRVELGRQVGQPVQVLFLLVTIFMATRRPESASPTAQNREIRWST